MPLAVRKALESIGLGDKAARVLLVLLENGPMLAAAVARAAKLNRTTTYGILKELSEKGLASSARKDGVTHYQSIAPELLPAYIERRGKDLLEIQEEISKIIPQIKLIRSKGSALPKVQFFEGREGVLQAFVDKLENNTEKIVYEFTGMDAAYEKLGAQFIDYYLKKRTALHIRSEYIAPDTPFARKESLEDERYVRQVKFIPAQYNMDTEISIYDNKVCMTSFSAENPVAIIIEDDTIARTMKTLFNYIRSTAT